MFSPLYLYKNKANTDVAFCPIKTFYVKEKQLYKIKVRWYNIGTKHLPYSMGITETIKIPKSKELEWELYWDIINNKRIQSA